MSAGRYVVGWLLLAVWVVPLVVAAVVVQQRLMPAWTGALAALTRIVLVVTGLVVAAELVGTFSQFNRPALTAGCLIVAAAALLGVRLLPAPTTAPEPPPTSPPLAPSRRPAVLVVVGTSALLAAQWGSWVARTVHTGVTHSDSVVYQLPYSVAFLQTGSTTALHLTSPGKGPSFHPANTELLNAMTMLAFHSDWLVPFVSLVWAVVALLAAWVLGRTASRPVLAFAGVAVLLALPGVASLSSGTAASDVPAAALCLVAVALLAAGRPTPSSYAVLAVAGLAAGLALGTKLTAVGVIACLTVWVWVRWPARRLAVLAAWTLPMLAGGAYWYLRNLVRVGSPVPNADLPFFPQTHQLVIEKFGYSVAHYATDWHVIRHAFVPGLRQFFGVAWVVLLLLALVVAVAALMRGGTPLTRPTAAIALLAVVIYTVTPTTALGPEGNPLLFTGNLRYLLPALMLVLGVLALVRLPDGFVPWLCLGLVVLALICALSGGAILDGFAPGRTSTAVVTGVVTAGIGAVLVLASGARTPVLALLAVAAVVAGLPVARHSEDDRYAGRVGGPLAAAYHYVEGLHDARVGYTGFSAEYQLEDDRLTNRVRFLGTVGAHRSLEQVTDCATFRRLVTASAVDVVVVGPGELGGVRLPQYAAWLDVPAAQPVVDAPGSRVYRITGPLDPSTCPAAT